MQNVKFWCATNRLTKVVVLSCGVLRVNRVGILAV